MCVKHLELRSARDTKMTMAQLTSIQTSSRLMAVGINIYHVKLVTALEIN